MNKITKWRQTHRHREQSNSCQRRGSWGLGESVKGLSIENKRLMDTDYLPEGKGGERREKMVKLG